MPAVKPRTNPKKKPKIKTYWAGSGFLSRSLNTVTSANKKMTSSGIKLKTLTKLHRQKAHQEVKAPSAMGTINTKNGKK